MVDIIHLAVSEDVGSDDNDNAADDFDSRERDDNYSYESNDNDVDSNDDGEETDGVGGDDDGDAIENDGDNDLDDTGDDDDDNYGGNDDDSDGNDSHGSDSDDDSDNDLDVVYLEEEMQMILDDNPSFTTLEVGVGNYYYYFLPPDNDWINLGRAIGNNRYLQEMSIYNWRANGQIITTENLVEFVSGFASNISIQKLSIADWDFSDVGIQDNLIRFFTDNQTIESLTVREKRKRGDGWKVRISALGIILHSFNSLKEMSLSSDDEDRGIICVDDVLEGLIGHAGLSKICLPRVRIERRGCTALASLLENLYSNHTSLTLNYSEFNVEGARILADGIRNNTTLTELNLDRLLYITKHGWIAIFDALQRSTCRLEKLSVESNYLSDDNIVARSLSLAILHHSSSLKSLGLGNNPGITGTGWNAIFQNLWGPNSMLETLSLKNPIAGYSITDEVLASLTNALQNNSKLKKLDLSYSTAVTVRGLTTFSTVLSNPRSVLEEVELTDCRINNHVMSLFAEALVNNKTLKALILSRTMDNNNSFTGTLINGCAAFTHILCNKSSIMSTYNSNHTLKRVNSGAMKSDTLPDDLASMLRLNGENTVSLAARLKIIKSHFSGSGINMQPFIDMGNCVRPHAIAWMVRDENAFQLLRAVPILLENAKVGSA